MEFSDDQIREAHAFSKFYINLLEQHSNYILYHLSETATLDWFGQTVKGPHNVSTFLKEQLVSVRHVLGNVQPVHGIGFRDTHNINGRRQYHSGMECRNNNNNTTTTSIGGKRKLPPPPRPYHHYAESTPPRQHITSSAGTSNRIVMVTTTTTTAGGNSRVEEAGQGDGLHNLNNTTTTVTPSHPGDVIITPASRQFSVTSSPPPAKRRRMVRGRVTRGQGDVMDTPPPLTTLLSSCDDDDNSDSDGGRRVRQVQNEEGEDEVDNEVQVRYVTLEGHMEFHKRSTKKYQAETRWQRPCKLHIAYTNYTNNGHNTVINNDNSSTTTTTTTTTNNSASSGSNNVISHSIPSNERMPMATMPGGDGDARLLGGDCSGDVSTTVHLVIYEGNMKCRRNLLKDFDTSGDEVVNNEGRNNH